MKTALEQTVNAVTATKRLNKINRLTDYQIRKIIGNKTHVPLSLIERLERSAKESEVITKRKIRRLPQRAHHSNKNKNTSKERVSLVEAPSIARRFLEEAL